MLEIMITLLFVILVTLSCAVVASKKKPGLDRVNATVHTQSIHFNESVDELVTFQWRKQAETLFIAVFLLACNVSRPNSLLILGGVGVRVSLP